MLFEQIHCPNEEWNYLSSGQDFFLNYITSKNVMIMALIVNLFWWAFFILTNPQNVIMSQHQIKDPGFITSHDFFFKWLGLTPNCCSMSLRIFLQHSFCYGIRIVGNVTAKTFFMLRSSYKTSCWDPHTKHFTLMFMVSALFRQWVGDLKQFFNNFFQSFK